MGKSFPENILKTKIKNGEVVYGPFSRINSPAVVEILGYAGFDFVIIDMEHGPLNFTEAENSVRSAQVAGITPIIRVPENKDILIHRALDTGASGVQVPQVNDVISAEYVVNSARYYPLGSRGVCKYVRSACYSNITVEDYFKGANNETLTVLNIEGEAAVRSIGEIASVPEVDVLFFGPYDLSQSLGIPGQVNDPKVVKAIEKSIDIVRSKGKAVGTFTSDFENAHYWAERGVQYVSIGIDTGLLYESTLELVKQLKKAR